MAKQTFTTPALAAFAAGRTPVAIGTRPDGSPLYPMGGGAEDAGLSALPSTTDLAGMTPDQVQEARERAQTEVNTLNDVDTAEMTDEQIDRLNTLADFLDAADADSERRETEAAERAERAEQARQRHNREPEATGPEEGEEGTGTEEGEEPAPAEEGAEGAEGAAPAPQAMAAGATRVPAPRRNRQPAAPAPVAGSFALVAAADVGGRFSSGMTLESMNEAAEAFIQRSGGWPERAPGPNVYARHQVASLRRTHSARVDRRMDAEQVLTVLREAADEHRLTEGNLVAAGGWCAPSETMYGLTAMETLDGIIDLPTVGVSRGGINYTPGPDFSAIYATAGFHQTEVQAIAGTEKPCVEVDCPDFSEVRLDAVGYCVKAPLLTRAAYPEVIQRWLEGTIVANQHKIAARLIQAMRNALGTAIAPTLTGTPLGWSLFAILERVIEGQRQAYRLGENDTLEVVLPRWARAALRADFANRNNVGKDSVSNEDIAQHFADRGARVQYVLNYQELANPKTDAAYPATLEVMVYPAGTFVKGTADVINLDTVYDTADLQTNVYTAAFVEDGVLIAKMQHGGARFVVPVHITGQMGADNISKSLGTSQVA